MTSDWTKVLNKASSKETASRKMSKTGLEKKRKPRIPACPLGKQLSHLDFLGPLLACLS